jgi:photosystem II stability/assembly factor-like uncharacterized protein
LASPARAGSLWEILPTEPYRGKQDDISFIDPDRGWYGNGAGKLYRTKDGGASWHLVRDTPGLFIRALGFVDASLGFLGNVGVNYYPGVTDAHPLYRTVDGGLTFAPVMAPGIDKVAGICGIDILRTQRIYQGELRDVAVIHAAGRVGGPAALMRSEDSGDSWRVIDLSAHAGMVLDVKFLTPKTGFIAAQAPSEAGDGEALILMTKDGGETWSSVYRSGRKLENCWKMSFPTARTGYATVQSYDPGNPRRVIIKTTNGGKSWKELPLTDLPEMQEFGIGFADEKRGWVGCRSGGFETLDGGKSWRPCEMGLAVNKIRIVRDDTRTRAFAIGAGVARLDL